MFFTLFGYCVRGGGGGQTGMVLNLLMKFFTPDNSKIEVLETLAHVLARIYVVFILFWVCVAWGIFSARWT